MMVINNKFNLGEFVFLKTDRDQYERMITGICVKTNGVLSYEITCGTLTTWHYEIELSLEKNILIQTR